MTEAELQKAVIDCARLLGWKVAHFRTAQTDGRWMTPVAADGKGFPDLCLVRGEQLLFAELKTEKGKERPEQRDWSRWILKAGVEMYLWRPSDWFSGAIAETLR